MKPQGIQGVLKTTGETASHIETHAKNAVLPMIGAALLAARGRTVLRNVPIIEDVRRAVELAEAVGAYVELHE
ncbi:hypothetical protein AB0C16_41020, partial [Nonomuraea sp. NPDC048916]